MVVLTLLIVVGQVSTDAVLPTLAYAIPVIEHRTQLGEKTKVCLLLIHMKCGLLLKAHSTVGTFPSSNYIILHILLDLRSRLLEWV